MKGVRGIITGRDDLVVPWVLERAGGTTFSDGASIGYATDKGLVAGALYDNFNGANINISLAGEGRNWLNREFLWFLCYYPFEQLKVRRVTALIAESNQASIKFSKHIGFVHEATLENAHPSGDLLVYKMLKENCKWLNLKGNSNGKQI